MPLVAEDDDGDEEDEQAGEEDESTDEEGMGVDLMKESMETTQKEQSEATKP